MSAIKAIAYLAAGLSILCGGIFILGAFGERGQAWWILFGLASIVLGWGLLWFTHRRAKATGKEKTPVTAPGDVTTQDVKPQKPKNILALLLMGLPVGALCGAISGCLLFYFFFKSREPGWVRLPTPPEQAVAILSVSMETEAPHAIDVLVKTETGRLYSCGSTATSCSSSQLTEDQATACRTRPGQEEISPRPPGNVIDSC